MNIIFASREDAEDLRQKYIVLELDSFRIAGADDVLTSWCVIDTSSISVTDLPRMTQYVDLHNNMMRNYRERNWKYCEDALEHLVGKWRGDVDSFYVTIEQRVKQYRDMDPGPNWDGLIEKNPV